MHGSSRTGTLGDVRLLVIEDYAPLRESVARGLRDAGYAVDATGDGSEGLWFAENHPYDVILLDLMLPGTPGLEILRRLRAMVDGLRRDSALFDGEWNAQTVLGREGGLRTFMHPDDGVLAFTQYSYAPADRPDYKLVLLVPQNADGARS